MQTVLFLDLFLEVGRRKLESQGSWKSADVFPCHKKNKTHVSFETFRT